jgi:hypothetical protein
MKCKTKYCRRRARKGKGFCCTCTDRKWRERHPIRYLLKNLRNHAKERGHEFSLTYEQFERFCRRTKYHELKGRDPNSLTVERKDETRGYHADNITVLRHSENIRRVFVPFLKNRPESFVPCVVPDDGGPEF